MKEELIKYNDFEYKMLCLGYEQEYLWDFKEHYENLMSFEHNKAKLDYMLQITHIKVE